MFAKRLSVWSATWIVIAAVLVSPQARADGYETDFDDLALGPIQHHPGDPTQDYWHRINVVGDAIAEIQNSVANAGNAVHLFVPATNSHGTQTSVKRDLESIDLTVLPIVTLSADFNCQTSDETSTNLYQSKIGIYGGPHPGYTVMSIILEAGHGTSRDVTGLDMKIVGFNVSEGYSYIIPMTVGQDLSWDSWHSVTLTLDHLNDTYLSITVDGESQDLSGHSPDRTFYEGEWQRGSLMESVIPEGASFEYGDPVVETDDYLFIDNISAQASPAPWAIINSIEDVPNDQGRSVRVKWSGSAYDAAGEPVITSYDIYRREDGLGCAPPLAPVFNIDAPDRLSGWDFVTSIPACGDNLYQCLVPTLCDSTAEEGVCWSTYFVRSMTPDPLEYFDSPPDSGYSIDNLPPSVPDGFMASYLPETGMDLLWEECLEGDFRYFNIYRGDNNEFEPAPENLIHQTIGTAWRDEGGTYTHYYKLTAVDYAGNESGAAGAGSSQGVSDEAFPTSFLLYQNQPNPVGCVTQISYDVPASGGQVALEIFSVDGRRICRLASGYQTAGRHTVSWSGTDDSARPVPAGFYLYRLTGPGFSETKRMFKLQ